MSDALQIVNYGVAVRPLRISTRFSYIERPLLVVADVSARLLQDYQTATFNPVNPFRLGQNAIFNPEGINPVNKSETVGHT